MQTQTIGEMRDSVSGIAPIGLFSSSPPHLRTSGETTNAGAPKPTPLAAFSEPPRVVSIDTAPGSIPPPPPRARDSAPNDTPARAGSSPSVPPQEPQRAKPRPIPWPLLAVPLAAAVCVLAFFSVRTALGPDEQEAVAELPRQPVAKPLPPTVPIRSPRATAPALNLPGASAPMRPYISAAELEDDSVDEAPEREPSDAPRHRSRRAALAARRNNAAVSVAQTPTAAPPANVVPARPAAPPTLVDEHIEEPAPTPAAAADVAARQKAEEHEATPSVVIAPPEPVAPALPPAKVEKTPSVPLPLTAKVRIDGVEVRGSLPKSQVRHAVERLTSQLQRCYEQAAQAAGHNGFGELIVGLEIDERGRARSPRVQGAGLPRLDGCVTETLQHLTTRVPDTGTVAATWKIVFMP
jgi:hypothetical protein